MQNKIKKIILSISACLSILIIAAFALLPLPGDIPVLMYHFVGTPEDARSSKNYVSLESLEKQFSFLSKFGYRPITLYEYHDIKTGKRKPRGKEIVITFDDGNYSIDTVAYPVLKKYAFPVTLFLVSGNVKNELAGSMTIPTLKKLMAEPWVSYQGHTKTHPYLSKLTDDQIREELSDSKKELEAMLEVPIDFLAYSSGDIDERVIRIAEESGYKLAFTTSPKKLKSLQEGPFSITRVKITENSRNPIVFWVHASGIYHRFKHWRHQVKKSKGSYW